MVRGVQRLERAYGKADSELIGHDYYVYISCGSTSSSTELCHARIRESRGVSDCEENALLTRKEVSIVLWLGSIVLKNNADTNVKKAR
jgi:hypothetical protein